MKKYINCRVIKLLYILCLLTNFNLLAITAEVALLYTAKIDTVLYIASKYNSENDIIYTFDKCMANDIYTFRYVALYSNNTDSINEDVTRPYSNMILNADLTDNIGPVGLMINGAGYWIGGNHFYTDSLGTNHRTAKTEEVQILINDSIYDCDFEMYPNSIKVIVHNSLYYPVSLPVQIKCISEKIEYSVDEFGINVNLDHEILENLNIVVYYGLQSVYNTSIQKNIYIFNSQHPEELDFENGIYSGSLTQYPDVYKVILSNSDKSVNQEMSLNMGCGLFSETLVYVNPPASFSRIFTSGGKTYFTQIRNKNIFSGDSYSWSGRYSWYDNNEIQVASPAGISIVYDISGNKINWEDVVGARSYNVYRSTYPYSGFLKIGNVSIPEYIDSNISDHKYFYKVTSVWNNLK